jgi:hypothetical protein
MLNTLLPLMAPAFAVGVLAVGAVLLSSCGGSHGAPGVGASAYEEHVSSGAGAPTRRVQVGMPARSLTRKDLAVQANAICRRFNAQISAIVYGSGSGLGRAEIMNTVSRRAAVEQKSLAELERLRPASSMSGDWQRVLIGRQALVNAMAKLGADALSRNTAGQRSVLMSIRRIQRPVEEIAVRDGFSACGDLK